MAKVYRVGNLNEVTYFNTAREADRHKPGGEEPESVDCVDAAGECNRLEGHAEAIEQFAQKIRFMLEELRDACPDEVIYETVIGRRVNEFIAENPLPPAGHGERDGQRSYGV